MVFRQGYGWRETNLVQLTHPDNLFRLASICKPITGCAITKLIGGGAFASSTKVYSYLGIPPWGGTLGDSRITNITVQQLLDHTAGWNRICLRVER
jgi:CubicO group peptidase (beta-lactamase class C family)